MAMGLNEAISLGVEEEYLLLHPVTGTPVPLSEEVRQEVGLKAITDEGEVQPELLQAQVEAATPVCTDLTQLGGHLLRLRHALGEAAGRHGCRLATVAAAPLDSPGPDVPVTADPRYRELHRRAGLLVDEQLINGMHVHVGVPDRDTAVAVLNRMRAWLPTLTAMSVNSPLWHGNDTGFASWRTMVFNRWPVGGPPPHFTDLGDYERRIAALIASGVIMDTGQLYWGARPSERYPTVEVRCLDVQLGVDEAVMFAGIVRALAATAIDAYRAKEAEQVAPPEQLRAATWQAARHGLTGTLLGPRGNALPAAEAVSMLLHHIAPSLAARGDDQYVLPQVQRLLRDGTGAERQRQAVACDGTAGLIALITESTSD
ncbi:glutamate--cysteine ligase [Streptomyces sp. NPDC048416]|uniref:carboxylate-amine ligase n=1 Tax=Streptomyces sp. NPDC048416 TaxID=3365546 RepID=UPI00371A455D